MDTMVTFLMAVIALMVVPGPDMAYCIASGMSYGKRGAFFSALGVGLGGVILAGTTAILVFIAHGINSNLFLIIQLLGCIYLLYLGLKILAPKHSEEKNILAVSATPIEMIMRGIITNVSNPKALVFFLSFIPQFIPHHTSQPAFYALGLGLLLCLIGVTMNFGFGLTGTTMTPLGRIIFWQRSLMQYVLSSVFFSIAIVFLINIWNLP